MDRTKIEWCDSTWNPITGCFHDCEYCYARRIAERFSTADKNHTFTGGHPIGKIHELNEPAIVTSEGRISPYPFGFEPTFHRYKLVEPRHWKRPRTIFVCSMADLFGEWVPWSWIEEVFAACDAAPQHRYIFLTKNPKRLCDLENNDKLPLRDNWWFGSTVDNKKARFYPGRLLDNIFISIEPLTEYMNVGLGSFGDAAWIIIGAETGNRKGKVLPKKEWVDNICEAANLTKAAVFMKDSLLPVMGEENMRREFPWSPDCPANIYRAQRGWEMKL